ncbi:Rid family hydrolase [Phaeobacter marinintestinus]|uniref:Rid family hydrolase n=1 Tax=Falsiphaeobacter marinintestinus TaxID=1492905 RepID=UPI0011B504E0|nr:Rid family hydrolase [Phaeobacter marinintestinus]
MTKETYFSGGRFEQVGSYARAKRVGPFVWVAGTTAIEPSGKLHAPDDAYAQSLYIFARIREALESVGAEMRHVVRTTGFLTDMKAGAAGLVRAHGEVFNGIDPVMAAVEAGLTTPGMVVEIMVDAVIHDENGEIQLK